MYAWYCILLKNFHRKSLYFEISSLELTHLSCIITILYHAYSLSHIWLFVTLGTVARQAPLSMGFSRQEYRSGLPYSPPRNLSNPGTEPRSPTLQVDSLPSEPSEKPNYYFRTPIYDDLFLWSHLQWKLLLLIVLWILHSLI